MRLKRALAAGMRSQGMSGGGGRSSTSLAHGDAELETVLQAVDGILADA